MGDESEGKVRCRGIRGATTVAENTREAILAGTRELLQLLVERNEIDTEDIASIFFTVTDDLDAEHPALAARQLGWTGVALLCAREIPVPGGLGRCVRVLLHANTTRRQAEIRHVYLREAVALRPNWGFDPSVNPSPASPRASGGCPPDAPTAPRAHTPSPITTGGER